MKTILTLLTLTLSLNANAGMMNTLILANAMSTHTKGTHTTSVETKIVPIPALPPCLINLSVFDGAQLYKAEEKSINVSLISQYKTYQTKVYLSEKDFKSDTLTSPYSALALTLVTGQVYSIDLPENKFKKLLNLCNIKTLDSKEKVATEK